MDKRSVAATKTYGTTGDYDCIIMSHSQFEKIPISAERKERMLQAQIDEIAYAIDDMKSQNEGDRKAYTGI